MSTATAVQAKLLNFSNADTYSKKLARFPSLFNNVTCSETLLKKSYSFMSIKFKCKLFNDELNRSAIILDMTKNRYSLSKTSKIRSAKLDSTCKELTDAKKSVILSKKELANRKVQEAYCFLEKLTKKLSKRLDSPENIRVSYNSRLEGTFNSELTSYDKNDSQLEDNPFAEDEKEIEQENNEELFNSPIGKCAITPIKHNKIQFSDPLVTPKGEMHGVFEF